MKIRKQRADYLELKSGIDKDVRLVGSRANASVAQRSRKFQRADCGGSYGDDTAFFVECAIDLCCRRFSDAETLAVHLVLFNFVDAYRLKRPETHMQRDFSNLDAPLTDRGQNLRRKMQPCSWRGHTAFLLCVHGLIALAVGRGVLTDDVRGKRDMAQLLNRREKIRHGIKFQSPLAKAAAGGDSSPELIVVTKADPSAHAVFSSRTHQRLPLQLCGLAGEQDFYFALQKVPRRRVSGAHGLGPGAGPSSQKPGGEDLAIVHNHEVAGAHQGWKFGKLCVAQLASFAGQMEHTGGAPRGERLLGNERFRKIKIEVGNQHYLDYICRTLLPGVREPLVPTERCGPPDEGECNAMFNDHV